MCVVCKPLKNIADNFWSEFQYWMCSPSRLGARALVFLTDNLGTDIPMNLFKEIIECYHNGSNFFIKVNIESTQKHQTQIVSSQVNSFYDFE